MDFRIKKFPPRKMPRLVTPQEGLRAIAEKAPQAEALACSWMELLRPLATQLYGLRRRIATVTIATVTLLLFVHVMFGANGMVVYKQKRAEYQSLEKKIVKVREENGAFQQKIEALKTDEKAIEKEAREQLRYARPGEYVYVQPPPVPPTQPLNHSAKK
jgi:cell division protein FtsB